MFFFSFLLCDNYLKQVKCKCQLINVINYKQSLFFLFFFSHAWRYIIKSRTASKNVKVKQSIKAILRFYKLLEKTHLLALTTDQFWRGWSDIITDANILTNWYITKEADIATIFLKTMKTSWRNLRNTFEVTKFNPNYEKTFDITKRWAFFGSITL